MPRSAADIKEILENGKIEFDWPDELGFNPGYTAIGEGTALPAQMDRYGHAGGNNFCSIPEAGAYTFFAARAAVSGEQRGIPRVELQRGYIPCENRGRAPTGLERAERAACRARGLRQWGKLNVNELVEAYENYLSQVAGKDRDGFQRAVWRDGDRGGGVRLGRRRRTQWTMPLSAQQMEIWEFFIQK